MAKVVITIQDGEEQNKVKLSMKFDPKFKQAEKCTPAQAFAFHVMECAQREMDSNDG